MPTRAMALLYLYYTGHICCRSIFSWVVAWHRNASGQYANLLLLLAGVLTTISFFHLCLPKYPILFVLVAGFSFAKEVDYILPDGQLLLLFSIFAISVISVSM